MTPTGIKRLLKQYPALYFKTIVPVMLILFLIALGQHHFVVGLDWKDIHPRLFIVPTLVGFVFGFLISSIRALLLEQQRFIRNISEHEQELSAEIKQRKQANKQEQRLAFALEGASDGIWDWNIVTGEVYYSPRWIEMLGYLPADVPPTYEFWVNRVHPGDAEEVLNNLQKHLLGQTESFNAEYRIRGGSGEWVWVLGRGKVMERDEQGNPLRAVGTQTDITEQRRIAAAVRGLLSGTAGTVGDSFFPELVHHLALTLEMRCAIVGSLRGEKDNSSLVSLAVWPTDLFSEQEELLVTSTPCTKPASGIASVIVSNAFALYPHDPLLVRLKAESYIGQPLLDKNGKVIGILATLDDRPLPSWKQKLAESLLPIFAARAAAELERRAAERALKQEKERAQITLASLGEAVISTDAHGCIDFMNTVAADMTGWAVDEAIGREFTDVCPILLDEESDTEMDFVTSCLRERRSKIPVDPVILSSRQGRLHVELSVSPIMGIHDQVQGAVVVLRDVSHTYEMARQMTWQATHDALTSLVNRKEFERQLQEVISYNRDHSGTSALLYLDLDQFKVVNDTCGHTAGDELLRLLSQLLYQRIRQTDTLARLGGDEFGVILHGCDLKQAREIAEKFIETISNFRFAWQDKFFDVGVSIGMVMLDRDTVSVASAMSAADVACYAAKDAGRNRSHVYQPNDTDLARRHGEMQWVSRIRHALEESRFLLCVQRIKNVQNNSYDMHEMLVRMLDENRNIVPPGSFISSAERYGLMAEIDRWVIDHAFKALVNCADRFHAISINLSALSLTRHGMSHYIVECQNRYGVDASKICFEITETAAIANLTRAIAFIHDLKSRGFKFSLDDFGSGLSSFSYLKNLPVDFLKIDGSFVYDMCADPIDLALVQAINGIGHTMGIRTIAEYVSDEATLKALRDMGVDYVQGYYVSKPVILEKDGANWT